MNGSLLIKLGNQDFIELILIMIYLIKGRIES